jgi:DHA3 family macrolide efflux protein-like MFS transporter
VGALLLEVLPMQAVLAVDVVTAILGMAPLLFVRVPQPSKTPAASGGQPAAPSFWGEMRAGLRYVTAWPGLMMILGMGLIINFLLNPAASLLPLVVAEHFQGGALQLATLDAVFGGGVIAGGILLSVWGGFRRRVYTSLVGLMGLGLGFVLLGLAPAEAFWLALVAAGIAAVSQALTNGPMMAILQAAVAPEMQGRVFSLVMAGSAGMAPLGLLIGGPVADWLGVQSWFLIGGAACVGMGVLGCFLPAVVNLEAQTTANQSAAMPLAPAAE